MGNTETSSETPSNGSTAETAVTPAGQELPVPPPALDDRYAKLEEGLHDALATTKAPRLEDEKARDEKAREEVRKANEEMAKIRRLEELWETVDETLKGRRRALCEETGNKADGCTSPKPAPAKPDPLAFLADPLLAVAVNTGALVASSGRSASGALAWILPALPVAGALIVNRDKGAAEAMKSAIAPAAVGGLALLLRNLYG